MTRGDFARLKELKIMSQDVEKLSDPLFIQPIWHPHPDPGDYSKLKSALYELEFAVDNEKIEGLDASWRSAKVSHLFPRA
jgi:hypothetical protein